MDVVVYSLIDFKAQEFKAQVIKNSVSEIHGDSLHVLQPTTGLERASGGLCSWLVSCVLVRKK